MFPDEFNPFDFSTLASNAECSNKHLSNKKGMPFKRSQFVKLKNIFAAVVKRLKDDERGGRRFVC